VLCNIMCPRYLNSVTNFSSSPSSINGGKVFDMILVLSFGRNIIHTVLHAFTCNCILAACSTKILIIDQKLQCSPGRCTQHNVICIRQHIGINATNIAQFLNVFWEQIWRQNSTVSSAIAKPKTSRYTTVPCRRIHASWLQYQSASNLTTNLLTPSCRPK